jgi:hypothetical protein
MSGTVQCQTCAAGAPCERYFPYRQRDATYLWLKVKCSLGLWLNPRGCLFYEPEGAKEAASCPSE